MSESASATRPDNNTRRLLLRHMLTARAVDEEARRLQKQGALDLWPSCQGQEAAQVGVALAAGPEATFVPSYREHAVALLRGVAPVDLLAQWAGRTLCGWDPRLLRFFPYTLVLAAQTLHAVGYSLGQRIQGREEFVVVFVGDGATSEGDMSEALNLAAVESACVLFVCQNNGWAISKPSHEQMRTSVAERARGFGVEALRVAGQDPESVYTAGCAAVKRVREKRAPYLIEIEVGRINGHSTADAHELYRTAEDLARDRAADPVVSYTARLQEQGVVDGAWLAGVEDELRDLSQTLVQEFVR